MPYLTDWSDFNGTGARNETGQTLEEFLRAYNPKKYDCPSNTVDVLVFSSSEPYRTWGQPLKLLMVRRKNHPNIGYWALPGGFVELRENLEDAAVRELQEETGVTGVPLMQLSTWGQWDRDPRWRVISTTYLALLEGNVPVKAGDDAADAAFMDVDVEEEEAEVRLTLTAVEKGIVLRARLRHRIERNGIVTAHRFEILSSEGIAGDHSCLIADALWRLREATR